MSIQKGQYGYLVRWREGGRQRQHTFRRKSDAQAFELETKRQQQLGALAPGVMRSRQTLAEFMEMDWWPRHAIPNLAPDTRRRYLEIWGTHLLPRLGSYPLSQITPMLVEDYRNQLAQAGVGTPTARKALMLLQGILARAVVRGLVPVNAAQQVRKPRQKPTTLPSPLSPETIERIRARLRPRDAILVSLLGYAGLRPAEGRGACWGDLQARDLHVIASKTGRPRDIDVLAPLMQDLREWRLQTKSPVGSRDLIVPRPTGGEWTREDWNNWRRRIWRPAAQAAGVTGDLRPYRLRGSFVSLLLWEDHTLTYVAQQAGHNVAVLAGHYAGVIAELEDRPRVPAAEAIRQARETVGCARSVREAGGML